jgi:pyrroline-5-carboxylate reductase
MYVRLSVILILLHYCKNYLYLYNLLRYYYFSLPNLLWTSSLLSKIGYFFKCILHIHLVENKERLSEVYKMNSINVGLVGIGRLGKAMMTHWDKHNIKIGVFHPLKKKRETFVEQFSCSYSLTESELLNLDVLILALPANNVIPFITSIFSDKQLPTIINMATALDTNEVKSKFPDLIILGVKYMGHARDLLERGDGLFITENPLPKQIEALYQYLGRIKIDQESLLSEVNKLATYYAVKAALEIENEFTKKGLSSDYVTRALTSLAPEVIRGYCEGTLGHFANEIVNEIKEKSKNNQKK